MCVYARARACVFKAKPTLIPCRIGRVRAAFFLGEVGEDFPNKAVDRFGLSKLGFVFFVVRMARSQVGSHGNIFMLLLQA